MADKSLQLSVRSMLRDIMTGSLPKEMTPIAWKIPSLIVRSLKPNVPLDSAGTVNPCVTTAIRMIIMLIKANVLALASYFKIVSTPSAFEYFAFVAYRTDTPSQYPCIGSMAS
jgi:hypothetical protein